LVFVLISLMLLYVAAIDRELIVDRRSLIGSDRGCVSCIALLSSDIRSKRLMAGGYSYAILVSCAVRGDFAVCHGAAGGERRKYSGVTAACRLVWLGPVVLSMIFSRFNVTSVLFLGERAAKNGGERLRWCRPIAENRRARIFLKTTHPG